jgi:hypothetical protein
MLRISPQGKEQDWRAEVNQYHRPFRQHAEPDEHPCKHGMDPTAASTELDQCEDRRQDEDREQQIEKEQCRIDQEDDAPQHEPGRPNRHAWDIRKKHRSEALRKIDDKRGGDEDRHQCRHPAHAENGPGQVDQPEQQRRLLKIRLEIKCRNKKLTLKEHFPRHGQVTRLIDGKKGTRCRGHNKERAQQQIG